MAQATGFAVGATAGCPDGVRGGVSRMTVDPAARPGHSSGHRAEAPAGARSAGPSPPNRHHGRREGDGRPAPAPAV
jgi:hypothetical protein